MKLNTIAIAGLALAGCGSDTEAPTTKGASPTATAPQGPRPEPGADLAGPIAVPDPNARSARRAPKMIDMMADRAIVKVSVPVPPHGGAVRFTFGDDRNGWVTRIPDSQQLPSVTYGREKIFVSGGFESVSFYALDAQSGEIDWATTNLEDNGPTAAVIEDEDVLFNTESCTLFSLNAETGKRNWFRYLGDPTLSQIAVKDGLVYASHPGDYGQQLSAYKVKTGVPVWTRAIGSELLATPVISGDSIYVSTLGGQTFRLEHRTGKLKWKKPLKATTAPWVAGEELYVSRRAGAGKEQQIVVSAETGAVLREHAVSTGAYTNDVPTDLADWKQVWAFEGSRPVVDRGIRYVAMGNEVHASDAASGDEIWQRRYPSSADQRALGSVALAGSAIVVSSRDGKIFGLDVDTGYTLWSYDLGKKVAAEPIIAKGWLYATTTDGYVVALDVADASLDGWHMFGGNAQKNGPVISTPPKQQGEATNTGPTASVVAPAGVAVESVFADAEKKLEKKALADAKAAQAAAIAAAAAERQRPKPFKIAPDCMANPLCKEMLSP